MFHDKLSEFAGKRASSEALPAGPTPYTTSAFFKTRTSLLKPIARSWEHHISRETLSLKPSVLKGAAMLKGPKDTISLGTGRPAAEFYPWSSISVLGSTVSQEQSLHHVEMSCTAGESAYDLSVALNYGYAGGSPQLLRFVTEHIELFHDPPYANWDCCLTCGTTSAIDIIFQTVCDRGDWVLTEEYTYPGTLDAAKSRGLRLIGVRMDERGLLPDDLDEKLKSWNLVKGKKHKVLYMVPTGQNPTGATQDLDRRKAIYGIAESHDLLIMEDDPYYFLQLDFGARESETNTPNISSVELYLRNLASSYLSFDVSGRVIRLDSTSKILAPGLRCSWLTASSEIVAKYLARTELSTVSPSGVTQVMLYKLLDETWGHDGFVKWLMHLSLQYRRRRDILAEACVRHLPTRACSWVLPTEGMFLWVKIHLPCETGQCYDETDIEERLLVESRMNGVVVSKGSWFKADRTRAAAVCYRMTFAAAARDTLAMGVRRFGDTLREVFGLD